jgi:hypothetical protein
MVELDVDAATLAKASQGGERGVNRLAVDRERARLWAVSMSVLAAIIRPRRARP